MKLILVNQRYGHTRTIVIRGWMKGLLSLCLLGAPVALGYLGYELALADSSNALVSQEARVASDEFVSSGQPVLLSGYQSVFADNPAGSARSQEKFHYALALVASAINPFGQLVTSVITSDYTHTRAVFAHGRLIDPAVYSSHTHH